MTPLEMLHTPLMSKQEIEYVLNDLKAQFLSRQCQSHVDSDTTYEDIFEGYSEDLCDNENEQAMFDAAYAYGWE